MNSFLCDSVSATIGSLTSENYHQAVEILNEHYVNVLILVSAHMQNFAWIPFVKD